MSTAARTENTAARIQSTPKRRVPARPAVLALILAATLAPTAALAEPPAEVRTIEGDLSDGATYRIEVPANWNGTLALFSHGLRFPGEPNPADTAAGDGSHDAMLRAGVALAGSSYATTGWAVEAVDDQLETLGVFRAEVGEPTRTIAWGESLGGMVSLTLAEQHPEVVDAAMPVCGLLAGGEALWNSYLDTAFVLTTLLPQQAAPQVVDIDDPVGNVRRAVKLVTTAEQTAEGRARLALAAAMAQIPGRVDPFEAPGTPSDVASRTQARIAWLRDAFALLAFGERAEMETRAGGNPSSNVGVDYERLLQLSRQDADVRAVYAEAGLDLADDLHTLAGAPRIAADAEAVDFLTANASFTGEITVPVLTLHDEADGLAPSAHERAYAEQVRAAGNHALLRPLFVDRAGHCTLTSAEVVTGLKVLEGRLDTGRWQGLRPAQLNAAATALGPELSTVEGVLVPPAFASHLPLPFPRSGSVLVSSAG